MRYRTKRAIKRTVWIIIILLIIMGVVWAYNNGKIKLPASLTPLRLTCQDELNNDIRMHEAKNPQSDMTIIEKASFVELKDAVEYVEKWNVDNTPNTVKSLRSEFAVNFGRIDLFLYQTTGQACLFGLCDEQTTTSSLMFGFCKGEDTFYPHAESWF